MSNEKHTFKVTDIDWGVPRSRLPVGLIVDVDGYYPDYTEVIREKLREYALANDPTHISEAGPFDFSFKEVDSLVHVNTDKTLTQHQERFILDTVTKWCEEHFPQMTESDFVQICEVKHQFHFKMMLENTHLGKRSSEWRVPKSIIKASAKMNFEQMAKSYKDAGQFGRRPSDIAIEKSIEESFRPFFDKNK